MHLNFAKPTAPVALLAVLQLNKVAETRNQTSEGVLKYFLEIITAALQAMPILMQHPDYGQHPVLQHPVFKSRAFLAFAQRQLHAYRTQTSMFAQLEKPIVGPVRTASTAYGSVSTPLYTQEQLQDTLAGAALSYAAGVSDSCNMQLPDGTWWMVVTAAEREQLLQARSQQAGAPRADGTAAGKDTSARSEAAAAAAAAPAPAAATAAAAAVEAEATVNGMSAGGGSQNTAAGAPALAYASADLQQPVAAAEQQQQPAATASQQRQQQQEQEEEAQQQQQQQQQGRQLAAGAGQQQSQVDAQQLQQQQQRQQGRQPAAGAGQRQSQVDAQQQQQPRADASQQQQQQRSTAAGPADSINGTGDTAAGTGGDSNSDMMATMVRMFSSQPRNMAAWVV
jgi:hypothetical protein